MCPNLGSSAIRENFDCPFYEADIALANWLYVQAHIDIKAAYFTLLNTISNSWPLKYLGKRITHHSVIYTKSSCLHVLYGLELFQNSWFEGYLVKTK